MIHLVNILGVSYVGLDIRRTGCSSWNGLEVTSEHSDSLVGSPANSLPAKLDTKFIDDSVWDGVVPNSFMTLCSMGWLHLAMMRCMGREPPLKLERDLSTLNIADNCFKV